MKISSAILGFVVIPSSATSSEEDGALLQSIRSLSLKKDQQDVLGQKSGDDNPHAPVCEDSVFEDGRSCAEKVHSQTCADDEVRTTCPNKCCACADQRGQIVAVRGKQLEHSAICSVHKRMNGEDLEFARVSPTSQKANIDIKDFLIHTSVDTEYIYAITTGGSGNFGEVKWGTWCDFVHNEDWKWLNFAPDFTVHEIRIYGGFIYGLKNKLYKKKIGTDAFDGTFELASSGSISHFDIDTVTGIVYATTDNTNRFVSQKLSDMTVDSPWDKKAHGVWKTTKVYHSQNQPGWIYAIGLRNSKIYRQNLANFDWESNEDVKGVSDADWFQVDTKRKVQDFSFYGGHVFALSGKALYKKAFADFTPENKNAAWELQTKGSVQSFGIELSHSNCTTLEILAGESEYADSSIKSGSMRGSWELFKTVTKGETYSASYEVSNVKGGSAEGSIGQDFTTSVTSGVQVGDGSIATGGVAATSSVTASVTMRWSLSWGMHFSNTKTASSTQTFTHSDGYPYMWRWELSALTQKRSEKVIFRTMVFASTPDGKMKPKCLPDCFANGDTSYQTCQSVSDGCEPCGWLPDFWVNSECPSDSPVSA